MVVALALGHRAVLQGPRLIHLREKTHRVFTYTWNFRGDSSPVLPAALGSYSPECSWCLLIKTPDPSQKELLEGRPQGWGAAVQSPWLNPKGVALDNPNLHHISGRWGEKGNPPAGEG